LSVSGRTSTQLDRLTAAIARLESALDAYDRRAGAGNEAMQRELRDLRASHSALQAEARTVTSRIDAVIGRLRAVAGA
jgi:hypothetical protein